MKILKYIPAHLVFFLMAGIILGSYFVPAIQFVWILLSISTILISVTYIFLKRNEATTYYFTFSTYVMFVCIGIASITFKNPQLKANDFSFYVSEDSNESILIIDNV